MTLVTVAAGVVALVMGGCESKLTKANYDRVQPGMNVYQVTQILGPGEKVDSGHASRVAQEFLGDITSAQSARNAREVKQGVGDLSGAIQERDRGMQREAGADPGAAAPEPGVERNRPPPSAGPGPERETFIWSGDRIEITVEFVDGKVVSKNQSGL
jgi:hypothetical protein